MSDYIDKAAHSISLILFLWFFSLFVYWSGVSIIQAAIIWSIFEFASFVYYFVRGVME